jgi:2-polyprenyl-6-methoxyphenol hydroxylase-like FAD-dependent oxidoreductase
VDVVVCGGGVAGTMAAVAAAREGAEVVLVERYGFLGGNASAGAVGQFNSWQTASGRRVIAGLAAEVVERLARYEGARPHQTFTMGTGYTMDRVEYAPEVLKLVLDDMVSEAGVRPLLHANLVDVTAIGRCIDSITLLTKGGMLKVRPRLMVDASGDLDAMRRAGAAFLELQEDEQLQPATMMFRFGPIDFEHFNAIPHAEITALAHRGFEQGELARQSLHAARDPFSDDGWFNISRLGIDATDALALSRGEIEGRRQAWRASRFLQANVPGCERGRLRAFATQLGIRETRRVRGDHVLTAEELTLPEQFADSIAAGAYPIDIHSASGGGFHVQPLGNEHAYQIPYRSLIPVSFDNALVAGRGISATHTALGAVRVMTISMAMGQAAGTAAAMSARSNQAQASVRDVSYAALRDKLLAAGACLA